MANRFAVDHEDGFILADFGLLNRGGRLLNRFTCVLPQYTLEKLKENLVQFSDKVGLPKKEIPHWNPPLRETKDLDSITLPVVDFLHVSFWDEAHAEICFWNFSQGQLADMVNADKALRGQGGKEGSLMPWGIAMVRCEIDLQRAFLRELYPV